MAKPGRKSAAELATLAPTTEKQARPDADYSLPDEQAEVWRAVIEALPADWIGMESLPLLSAYCRTTVALRRLGQLIHQAEFEEGPLDIGLYSTLLKNHAQQAQVLKTLATSLRLTPQSRFRAETAARTVDAKRPGPRPWDIRE
jgi:hypothetical protein